VEQAAVWQSILAAFCARMGDCLAARMVRDEVSLEALEGDRAKLAASSGYWATQLGRKHRGDLLAAFAQVLGREVRLEIFVKSPINNINNNYNLNINSRLDSSREVLLEENNINIINRDYSGLRAKIHSDPVFLEVQSWGVDAPFIYAAVRDNGEAAVKGVVQRLKKLADSYFRQWESIPHQRGRLFNVEMKKLKAAKRSL
jgi:hypothetical protein